MKKNVPDILIVAIIMCLFAGTFLVGQYRSTIDVSDSVKISNYIAKEKKVQNVKILAQKSKGEYLAALYNNGTNDNLIIFEKDKIFKSRYIHTGGGGSSNNFSTYNLGKGASQTTIIVYGNNTKLKAASYKFVNSGKTYISQELGEYVLDIYIIEGTSDISSDGFLYDKNGNEICML